MINVYNKIAEKMKVTDSKALIYAYDIVIWGDSMKQLEIRLAHWERESKNYGLQINLSKTVMLGCQERKNKHNNENKQKRDKSTKLPTWEVWWRKTMRYRMK
jgi:hypothetical protein